MATAVIAQGGGPTPVVNASLVGAVREAMDRNAFSRFLGSVHGLQGVLQDQYIDLYAQGSAILSGVALAPGAALGSSRDPLDPARIGQLLESLRKRDVRYLFYIGGNGSMGTAMEIDLAARAAGYELYVTGIPKTVDNDLVGTDHTPGYGSAARYYAHVVRDMGMDHRALPSPIVICEVIGRNVGWLVAATAFARKTADDAPHLIYFPENPLPRQRLLADIEAVYRRWGRVFVCICEGQQDEDGGFFGADVDSPDNPQRRLPSNLAHSVARYVSAELKLRSRSERPSLLARCCSAFVSETDRAEAELVGRSAVSSALAGNSGMMVALMRETGVSYRCETVMKPLEAAAWRERRLPTEFRGGTWVTDAYLKYAEPLIGTVHPYMRLQP